MESSFLCKVTVLVISSAGGKVDGDLSTLQTNHDTSHAKCLTISFPLEQQFVHGITKISCSASFSPVHGFHKS